MSNLGVVKPQDGGGRRGSGDERPWRVVARGCEELRWVPGFRLVCAGSAFWPGPGCMIRTGAAIWSAWLSERLQAHSERLAWTPSALSLQAAVFSLSR